MPTSNTHTHVHTHACTWCGVCTETQIWAAVSHTHTHERFLTLTHSSSHTLIFCIKRWVTMGKWVSFPRCCNWLASWCPGLVNECSIEEPNIHPEKAERHFFLISQDKSGEVWWSCPYRAKKQIHFLCRYTRRRFIPTVVSFVTTPQGGEVHLFLLHRGESAPKAL